MVGVALDEGYDDSRECFLYLSLQIANHEQSLYD